MTKRDLLPIAMKGPTMRALRAFRYAKRNLKPGDEFTAKYDGDARVFHVVGHAVFVDEADRARVLKPRHPGEPWICPRYPRSAGCWVQGAGIFGTPGK
jgi:hypothetical protein